MQVSDNFQRPDGPLGPNYTPFLNIPPIISNHGFTNGSGSSDNDSGNPSIYNGGGAYWNAVAFTRAHWAEIQISAIGAASTDCMPSAAIQCKNDGSCYIVLIGRNTTGGSGQFSYEIWKIVAGNTGTLIGGVGSTSQTNNNYATHVGDTVAIAVDNAGILSVYYNRVLMQTIDDSASPIVGGQPGIFVSLGSAGSDHPASDTIGTNFSAGSGSYIPGDTVLETDNFQRPNENPLSDGGNWGTLGSYNACQVVNDDAIGTSGISGAIFTGVSWANTQTSKIIIDDVANSDNFIVLARGSSSAVTYYGLQVLISSSGFGHPGQLLLYRFVNGGATALSDISGQEVSTVINRGDTFEIKVSGQAIAAFHNDVLISGSGVFGAATPMSTLDSFVPSGSPGFELSSTSGISNWVGGTLITPYSVSGNAGIAGATVSWSGGPTPDGSVTADGSGNFNTGEVLAPGTYTITPTKAGEVFTPASRLVTISTSDVTGLNFTAAAGVYSVPDDRAYGNFPNHSRNVQGTLTYDVPSVDSRAAGAPVDSRAEGAPVDSRVAPNIPENSRSQPPF